MNIFIKILQSIGINKSTSDYENIDKRKTKANLYVLSHGSYKVAEVYCRFDDEQKELLRYATKSIKEIDPLGGIPLCFSYEFVAIYPDVVLWWNKLPDEEQEVLLKDFDENDLLDKDKKIKQKYLKVLVDKYISTGKVLECALDNKEG